jgi:hypothetical protein
MNKGEMTSRRQAPSIFIDSKGTAQGVGFFAASCARRTVESYCIDDGPGRTVVAAANFLFVSVSIQEQMQAQAASAKRTTRVREACDCQEKLLLNSLTGALRVNSFSERPQSHRGHRALRDRKH